MIYPVPVLNLILIKGNVFLLRQPGNVPDHVQQVTDNRSLIPVFFISFNTL